MESRDWKSFEVPWSDILSASALTIGLSGRSSADILGKDRAEGPQHQCGFRSSEEALELDNRGRSRPSLGPERLFDFKSLLEEVMATPSLMTPSDLGGMASDSDQLNSGRAALLSASAAAHSSKAASERPETSLCLFKRLLSKVASMAWSLVAVQVGTVRRA